jgi:hypothetical protein
MTSSRYSWSLRDPFLKGFVSGDPVDNDSVLASFYCGNVSYPSKNPLRLGLLSTAPQDVNQRLRDALQAASIAGGNFPCKVA